MEMNKIHEYRGFKFNIKVELNYKVEKKINGVKYHKITLNDMGPSNYYKSYLCETDILLSYISDMINSAEEWVDNLIDGPKPFEQKILESIGFTK